MASSEWIHDYEPIELELLDGLDYDIHAIKDQLNNMTQTIEDLKELADELDKISSLITPKKVAEINDAIKMISLRKAIIATAADLAESTLEFSETSICFILDQ